MAHHKMDRWTALLIVGLLLFGGIYVFLAVSGSGLLPGDTGTEGVVDAADSPSTGPFMNLGAWSWTSVVLTGTAFLAIALAYAQWRTSRLTRTEFEQGEREVRRAHSENREL